MRYHRLVLAFVAVLAMGSTVGAQPVKFALDNAHSSVIFGVGHLGLSYVYGSFGTISGEFTLDNTAPAQSQFKIVIEAASVDTNNDKRDEHLRSADFFDVEKFPNIEFVSTAVTKTDNGMDLKGNLTLHGVTKEISIPLTKVGEGNSPFGDYRAGFIAQFSLKRSEFEMKSNQNAIGDSVSITFSFQGVKQP